MTQSPLRQILALDAATCVGVFVLGVLATGTVARVAGLPEVVVSSGGWICLAAAALLGWLAARPSRGLLGLAIAGNAAWVLASVAVWIAFFGDLTAIGHAVIIAQAVAVEVFTMLELRGFRAMGTRVATA